MALQNNLNSYRFCYDSSSEDESSSTSSGSDFLQMVVERSSGSKNVSDTKTKGELGLDDLPPIEELCLEIPKEDIMLIGKIHAVVEKLVVVQALKDMKPLDIDSVLFLDHNKPLGHIYDVFGPVVEPFYCIRFNSVEEINQKSVEIGANVFFAPNKNDITSYVFVDQLQKEKGSDASWRYNNEPPEECLDFSDDEEEMEARKKRKCSSRLTATRFSAFSNRLFYPPHNPSPSVTKIIPFSSSYPSQPPPSPSISVAAGQNFSFLNARPYYPPSPSLFSAQWFNPFSNPPPLSPPFFNSYARSLPPSSPVFPPSNQFSSSYPTTPSTYPAHICSPSPSFSPPNSNVVAESRLPLFTPQNALQRHPISSPNLLPHSVNHTTPSSQHCVAPIFSPLQQPSLMNK